MAVYELGGTEEEYLRMSPRQLNILIGFNRRHRIGILNEVAAGILTAREETKEEDEKEVDSFSEIL